MSEHDKIKIDELEEQNAILDCEIAELKKKNDELTIMNKKMCVQIMYTGLKNLAKSIGINPNV